MKRMLIPVAGVAAVVAIVFGTQAALAATRHTAGSGSTIRLIETAQAVNLIPPVGNRFVFSSTLTDAAGNPAGHDGGDCTTTNPDGEALCTIAVSLGRGEIALAGLATGTDNTFAITGGTGAYRDATGVARAVDVAPGTANITIQLDSL